LPTARRDSILNSERTWTAGAANVFGFRARALNPSLAFWLAMFVGSAFGMVLGDFWAEGLHLGLVLSFGTLVVITGPLIWGDCLNLNALQHLGLDVIEGDFETENGGGHAARLRRCRSATQFQAGVRRDAAQDDRRCGRGRRRAIPGDRGR
jgi:hypothetical protein